MNKFLKIALMVALATSTTVGLNGCTNNYDSENRRIADEGTTFQTTYGIIISSNPVKIKEENLDKGTTSAVAAIGGAVAGSLIGYNSSHHHSRSYKWHHGGHTGSDVGGIIGVSVFESGRNPAVSENSFIKENSFVITANWCKNGNRTALFGMNIVIRIILMGLIAVLGSNAAGWLVVLGILYGVFEGFYNLPMHAITIENVCAKRMVFFVGTKEAIVHTFKILVPVTLGTMLTTTSLQSVAWTIMIMAIMEFFMLFLLPPCRNPKHQPIDFIGFYNHLKETPVLRKIFLSELLRSFAWILETVVVMLADVDGDRRILLVVTLQVELLLLGELAGVDRC